MKKYLLIVMSFVFLLSCFDNSRQLKDKNRIFRTAGKYYVYYNGNTMEMPANLYITGDKKLEDYYAKGWLKNLNIEVMNKSELLNDLDKFVLKTSPNKFRTLSTRKTNFNNESSIT